MSKKINLKSDPSFSGFSQSAIKFFRDLSCNNNRAWFNENRERYIRFVAEPMKQLVREISPAISGLDPLALTATNRVISRIYRDTRFSADQSPYRPRVWFAFKHDVEYWASTPAYFFQFDANGYMFGAGMYSALPATMRKFREIIDNDPERFREIIKPIQKNKDLDLESDQYKRRLPSDYPEIIDRWYQSRSIAVLGSRKPDKILFSAELVDFLIGKFILLKPLYDLLWSATVIKT